jgi:hypothetical protein
MLDVDSAQIRGKELKPEIGTLLCAYEWWSLDSHDANADLSANHRGGGNSFKTLTVFLRAAYGVGFTRTKKARPTRLLDALCREREGKD